MTKHSPWTRWCASLSCLIAGALLAGCGGEETLEPRKPTSPEQTPGAERTYPELPQAMGAFGSAYLDGAIYLFGGHIGSTHNFSKDSQSPSFLRLQLAKGSAWERLPDVEPLESSALAVHEGLLYRTGGLRADNEPGATESLQSVDTVRRFDPAKGTWDDVAPMPEGRSAHGAVVVGDVLYVVAGWALSGDINSGTFKTGGFKLDLATKDAVWEPIPEPPMKLRSLAVAAVGDVIYTMGGVTDTSGGFTDVVYKLDTKTSTWTEGPRLPTNSPIKAFSAAACSINGRLYVNYADGVYRLKETGDGWEVAGTMKTPRIANALLCVSEKELVAVGGFGLTIDAPAYATAESIAVSP